MRTLANVSSNLLVRYLCAAVIALVFSAGCDSRHSTAPRFTSYSNLYSIGIAISKYEHDHQKPPQGLADLVPQYIPFDQIGVFYVTNKYVANPSKPSDWASNASRLDAFSSYTYLGTNSTGGVLAFEKLDLWKPENPQDGKLAVLFADLHVEYVSSVKLQELLSGKTPAVAHSP